ncbi:MAG: TIGR02391 family protein [Planctomycetaceae bacterium]|nr:TIGR02391 family protein [Planctomycetaceae bacterium]
MSDFFKLLPNRLDVLSLETADLASILLEYLHSIKDFDQRREVMKTRFIAGQDMVPEGDRRHDVSRAVIEAWSWLIREGLLVPYPLAGQGDSFDFSRLGLQLKNRQQLAEYQRRLRCPRELLHKMLIEKAWPIFLRGEYDTAVFQAFKEVEVSVRGAGGYTVADYGKDLMRKAFRPTNENPAGPLSDSSEPLEEQKSLQEFFAGAYGRVRNPTAHRHGVLTDPVETFEMLIVATHLLRIIDRRKPADP